MQRFEYRNSIKQRRIRIEGRTTSKGRAVEDSPPGNLNLEGKLRKESECISQ